ncbi:MAG: hypothetical protein KAR39_09730 [Thermoplasmata archaeon]|nr:hypothetical protein [Thermoplasmata archaeon]
MDPDSDPQRQPNYPPQYPPQYPQQYPPPAYPPPYYMPYQPPKKDDKKIMTIIIIVIIVVFVVPTVLAAVLYFVVIGLAPTDFPPGSQVPTGVWGAKMIISSTEVHIDFGPINPEQRPVDIDIILVRNGTVEGGYYFTSNDDGMLWLARGTDVGTLLYSDLADNQRINIGDRLEITNLHPMSDYRLVMIWSPTGDQITSTFFSTP